MKQVLLSIAFSLFVVPAFAFDCAEYNAMCERYRNKSENFQFYCENVVDVTDDQQFQQALDFYCDPMRDYAKLQNYRSTR